MVRGDSPVNLYNELNYIINFIDGQPEVNISGIKKILIDNILSSSIRDNIYWAVFSYVTEIEECITDRRENSFDNRVGALNRLREIRRTYS